MKNCKDLRLRKVDKLLISYNITNSWLFLSNSFDFIFSLRDSENLQYGRSTNHNCSSSNISLTVSLQQKPVIQFTNTVVFISIFQSQAQ